MQHKLDVTSDLTNDDKIRSYFLKTMVSLNEKIIKLNQRITELKSNNAPSQKDLVELGALQEKLNSLLEELLDFQQALRLQVEKEQKEARPQKTEVNSLSITNSR